MDPITLIFVAVAIGCGAAIAFSVIVIEMIDRRYRRRLPDPIEHFPEGIEP